MLALIDWHTLFCVDPEFIDNFAAAHPDLTAERIAEAAAAAPAQAGYDVQADVAVIVAGGPISKRRTGWLVAVGGTAMEDLAASVAAAAEDGSVRAILLVIDSPGGSTAGLDTVAAEIERARRQKPVVAFVEGRAGGIAYALAAECDRVYVDVGSTVGPIGVCELVTAWHLPGATAQAAGYDPDPAIPQQMADLIVGRICERRGLDPARVQRLVEDRLVSEQAEAAGIIDGILPRAAVIDRLRRGYL